TRAVDYNPNAWLALVPMANVVPGAPVVGATTSVYGYLTQTGLTGWGPAAGFPATPLTGNAAIFSPNNNIVPQSLYGSRDNVSELPGMRRFDMADRRRHKLRSSLDWQASEHLSLQMEGEFNKDDYQHSVYGLLQSQISALHLEGSYVFNDNFELPVFYSHEDLRSSIAGDGFGSNTGAAFVGRPGNTLVAGGCYATVLEKNHNGKIDPCLNWFTDMRERADTFGLTLARNNLSGGRLSLAGDLVGPLARTDIGVRGGSYAHNPFALANAPPLAPGVAAVFFIPAADLPPVTTRTLEIRLRAQFALSRASQLNLLAAYQRLKSSDFAYDGMQFGTGPNSCRPTNSRTAIRPPCSGFPTCIASSDETTVEILCQRLARDRAPPTRHPCTALGHGRHSGRLGQRDPLSGDHRTQDAAASAHGIAPATRVAGAAAPGGTGG